METSKSGEIISKECK